MNPRAPTKKCVRRCRSALGDASSRRPAKHTQIFAAREACYAQGKAWHDDAKLAGNGAHDNLCCCPLLCNAHTHIKFGPCKRLGAGPSLLMDCDRRPIEEQHLRTKSPNARGLRCSIPPTSDTLRDNHSAPSKSGDSSLLLPTTRLRARAMSSWPAKAHLLWGVGEGKAPRALRFVGQRTNAALCLTTLLMGMEKQVATDRAGHAIYRRDFASWPHFQSASTHRATMQGDKQDYNLASALPFFNDTARGADNQSKPRPPHLHPDKESHNRPRESPHRCADARAAQWGKTSN